MQDHHARSCHIILSIAHKPLTRERAVDLFNLSSTVGVFQWPNHLEKSRDNLHQPD